MKTLAEFDRLLPNDDACKKLLVEMRWPDGVKCPRCGNAKVYALKARPFHWVCKSGAHTIDRETGEFSVCAKNGGYRFSVITHTIFQDTKIPLTLWFKTAYLMLTAKKGISALQIYRVIFGEGSGHDYRTIWFMCMRLRAAMQGDVIEPLGSKNETVEVDETYIGGKQENRHWKDRQKYSGRGGANTGKTAVIGAIARKGNVVCKAISGFGSLEQQEFVRKAVSTEARLLATDESGAYREFSGPYNHKTVNHSEKQYVVGTVHTNTIESFWSLLKRGIIGSYHHVSDAYLPLYLNEFAFRFNNRKNPRMFEALLQTVGN